MSAGWHDSTLPTLTGCRKPRMMGKCLDTLKTVFSESKDTSVRKPSVAHGCSAVQCRSPVPSVVFHPSSAQRLYSSLRPFPGGLTPSAVNGQLLTSCYAKCGLQTSSVSWGLVRNADSQAHARSTASEGAFE